MHVVICKETQTNTTGEVLEVSPLLGADGFALTEISFNSIGGFNRSNAMNSFISWDSHEMSLTSSRTAAT